MTKRMTATERDTYLHLNVAYQIMSNALRDLNDESLKRVKFLKRDLRMMEKTLERICTDVIGTIPDEQKRGYCNMLRDSSYRVGVKCRATANMHMQDEYGVYMTFDQINVFLDAIKEKCHYCGLDNAGIARCELRKALDELPNDTPECESGCKYYTVI